MQRVRDIADELLIRLQKIDAGSREAYPTLQAVMQNCLDQLAATEIWGEANRLPSSHLWKLAGHLLEAGELQSRARFKPCGYAGDYVMLTKICSHELCDHPLGKLFDLFFQEQAAPGAVRNRTELIAREICRHYADRPAGKLVSVGSGPAIDVCRALQSMTSSQRAGLQVTLLDLDPAALDRAEKSLSPFLPAGQLICLRENLFRLPKMQRAAPAIQNADFLVCSGLFDYLADDDAVAMLSLFRESLTDDGQLLVFNFAPHNPSRAYMEWIGNWYLIYRNRDDLHRLALQAGFSAGKFTVEAEPLGVNLFLRAEN